MQSMERILLNFYFDIKFLQVFTSRQLKAIARIVFQCRLNFLHFNFCSTAAVTASDIRDTFYGRTVRQIMKRNDNTINTPACTM